MNGKTIKFVGLSNREEIVHASGARELTSGFSGVRVARSLFFVMF
jgi:hypothetical protein